MPLYKAVDLRRIRSMTERCLAKGVLTEAEAHQWSDFLDREERKEQFVNQADQNIYSKENGKLISLSHLIFTAL